MHYTFYQIHGSGLKISGSTEVGSVSLSVSGFLRMRPTAIKTLAKISYFSVRASFSRTFSSGWFPFPAAFLQDRPQESQPGFLARPHASALVLALPERMAETIFAGLDGKQLRYSPGNSFLSSSIHGRALS